eukprot:2676525-Rhodomonas_salina.1
MLFCSSFPNSPANAAGPDDDNKQHLSPEHRKQEQTGRVSWCAWNGSGGVLEVESGQHWCASNESDADVVAREGPRA